MTFVLSAVVAVTVASAASAIATVSKKVTENKKNRKIEEITRLLNKATSKWYESYHLDVDMLRLHGAKCSIDTKIYGTHEYEYRPIDHVYDVNNMASAHVAIIEDDMYFDAILLPVTGKRTTSFLLFLLIGGEWAYVGSPYEYDAEYTDLAHKIVWESMGCIKKGDNRSGKCRVWLSK